MKAAKFKTVENLISRLYGCYVISKTSYMFCWLMLYCVTTITNASAQPLHYSTQQAHAHNDYEHDSAFIQAYYNGFGSMEADVFPLNGQLMLAHDKADIKNGYTLTSIYLRPLQQLLLKQPARRVQLLIDIKDNYPDALAILQQQLQPLVPLLSTPARPNQLTIVISGNKPAPSKFNEYPFYIFFDNHFDEVIPTDQLNRVALISLPWYKVMGLKASAGPSANDILRLHKVVDSAHSLGKPVRFWAAPDIPALWLIQQQAGVDYIGTDRISQLAAWLRREE